jgi:hypothetical protein
VAVEYFQEESYVKVRIKAERNVIAKTGRNQDGECTGIYDGSEIR